jgi:hypothetical protein
MKTFEKVLFLIAFLFIDIYTTRHIYLLWLAPRTSVLDEFKGETEKAIDTASELKQLLAKYRPARDAVVRAERQNAGKPQETWRFEEQEPFKTEITLRRAIEEWEAKQQELFEMRVYWGFGFVAAIAGFIIHRRRSQLLGLALMISGFAEMTWWCSPTWISQTTAETDRLLGNKLALSLTTMLLLLIGVRFLGMLRDRPVAET